jgi:hypothetical protein
MDHVTEEAGEGEFDKWTRSAPWCGQAVFTISASSKEEADAARTANPAGIGCSAADFLPDEADRTDKLGGGSYDE